MSHPICVLQHEPHVQLGSLAPELDRFGFAWRALQLFRSPADDFQPRHWSGLIILGGAMNVDQVDRFAFLAREADWLRSAIEAELPVLGICLGAQLLAKALGERVRRNHTPELGWHAVDWTPAAATDPVFHGLPTGPYVFQWHSDTFDLPRGAAWLAHSALCRNQAFRYGRAAYGVQFHFEMTAAMIDEWTSGDNACAALAAAQGVEPEPLSGQTALHLPAMQAMAATILGRFLELCRPSDAAG